jgi:hypothetical protein
LGLAGVALVLAAAFAGCGETPVEEGPVPYKATDISQFEKMKNSMIESMKTRSYTKKPAPPKEEAKK